MLQYILLSTFLLDYWHEYRKSQAEMIKFDIGLPDSRTNIKFDNILFNSHSNATIGIHVFK
jgi:hypothetical protein